MFYKVKEVGGVKSLEPLTQDGYNYTSAPIGTILAYGGSTAPENFMLCNGAAVSRTQYSELFGVIGTSFGPGDGSTTFNLPDLSNADNWTISQIAANLGIDASGAISNAGSGTNVSRMVGLDESNALFASGSWQSDHIYQWGSTTTATKTALEKQTLIAKSTRTTQPIQYIIKVANATVPYDYSDYVETHQVNYSTTERMIGKWIDGRPVYQKTLDIGNAISARGNTNYPHGITSLDKIIAYNGFCKLISSGANIYNWPIPYLNNDDVNGAHVGISDFNDTDVVIYSSWGLKDVVLTIEYIKTV